MFVNITNDIKDNDTKLFIIVFVFICICMLLYFLGKR